MKTVTSLTTQKKNRHRISVYLDDSYAFSLENIIAARLTEGQILDETAISSLTHEDELERAWNLALKYLGIRSRSTLEIERYLKEKKFSSDCIKKTVERLKKNSFIDDVAFAEMWIENRIRLNPKGAYALKQELLEKGLDRTLIEEKLNRFDESPVAFDAVRKKMGLWCNLPHDDLKKKIYRFLSQRGFSYETTYETSARIIAIQKEEEDGSAI